MLLEEPDCPYVVIGRITSKYTVEQYVEDMREEAAQFGGDAVVGFSHKDFGTAPSFSGNVVRFLDSDCQQ
jgi:hypothetical protein